VQISTWLLLLLLGMANYVARAQNSLSLNDAIELAIRQNRTLRADSLNVVKAEEQIRIMRSIFLPSAGIDVQLLHYFKRPAFFGFGEATSADKIPYTRLGGEQQGLAQASLRQSVYTPGASAGLQKSKLLYDQSKLGYNYREIDVVAEVKRVYLRILVLEKRLALQNESILRNKKALDDSRSLLAQGRALRVDTLRAYTSVKNLEPEILRLEYAIKISKQQLNVLTGSEIKRNLLLKDSLSLKEAAVVPVEDEVVNAALNKRPDIKILSLNKWVADKDIAIAKSAWLPSVNLLSQFQLPTQSNNFKLANASYPPVFFVGAQLSIPIFSGFAKQARVRQAQAERKQAELNFLNATEELKTEVKQVLASIDETSKRLKTQQSVADVAETSYSITGYRYTRGIASRLELIDAELALTTAKANYLEAIYDYQAARIELDRVSASSSIP